MLRRTAEIGQLAWSAPHSRRSIHIRRTSMSLQTHLVELEKKHKALESAISAALARPSATDVELAELKRKKLQLKDEITKLKASLDSKVTLH
jgi:hypothetical protein